MQTITVRTHYAPHDGSNVGDIVATGAGRRHRRRIDQANRIEDEHRAAAITVAERAGITAPAVIGEPATRESMSRGWSRRVTYVWTIGGGWPAVVASVLASYSTTHLGVFTDDDNAGPDGRGWTHDLWSVVLTHTSGRVHRIDYRMGTGHNGQAPDAADVLMSWLEDGRGTTPDYCTGFNDWAATYGYDTDSRTAERVYLACVESWHTFTVWAGDDRDMLCTALDTARDNGEV